MNFLARIWGRISSLRLNTRSPAIGSVADVAATGADLLIGLPLATPVLQAFRLKNALSGEFFNQKIVAFISQVGQVSDHDRINFLQSLDKQAEEFTNNLLLTIDRLDEKEKAAIIGRLFRATVIKFLPLPVFRRLVAIVSHTYLDDLALLPLIYNEDGRMHDGHLRGTVISEYKVKQPDQHASLKTLANAGLLTERPMQNKLLVGMSEFKPNDLGLALLQYGYS